MKWGFVARNVAKAVDPPRPKRPEVRVLDAEGVARLLESVQGTPYHPLFHLGVHTGLRRSELLGLRWKDLDLDLLTLSVVQVLQQLKAGEMIIQ